MNRLAAFALAFFAAPAFAAGSPVATLGQQQGTVMVNQGEVFATATENQALSAGDRVLVMEGASATLVFSDGCELPLVEGSLLEVGAASPCAGLVMLSEAALEAARAGKSTSFAIDLGKWNAIMEAYLNGGHAYHATMPTDALMQFRDAMQETKAAGYEALRAAQWEQGNAVRAMLAARGVQSVAAEGFTAPGVVVSFTDDPDVQNGKKFAAIGYQIAAGVPLMVDEGPDYKSFRLGLFGLDKLKDVPASLARLEGAFNAVF